MKSVDIFLGIDRLQHRLGIDPLREGELDENSVDLRIVIQFFDEGQKILQSRCFRKGVMKRGHPGLFTRLVFVFDVNLRGFVGSDENGRQPRNNPLRFFE